MRSKPLSYIILFIPVTVLLFFMQACTGLSFRTGNSDITELNSVRVGSSIGSDYRTITEALELAELKIIYFILSDEIYTESGISVDRRAVLIGQSPEKTVIQGASEMMLSPDRIFTVTDSGVLVIRDLSIRNGYAREILRRGGGILNLGRLTAENCLIHGNIALYGAGIDNRGTAHLSSCTISDNKGLKRLPAELSSGIGCTGSGGGIKNEPGGFLYMSDCIVSGNSTNRKGGGLFISCDSAAVIEKCRFTDNTARINGGGIFSKGNMVLKESLISRNTSLSETGGVFNTGIADIILTTITENSPRDFTDGNGGGFYGTGFTGLFTGNLIK